MPVVAELGISLRSHRLVFDQPVSIKLSVSRTDFRYVLTAKRWVVFEESADRKWWLIRGHDLAIGSEVKDVLRLVLRCVGQFLRSRYGVKSEFYGANARWCKAVIAQSEANADNDDLAACRLRRQFVRKVDLLYHPSALTFNRGFGTELSGPGCYFSGLQAAESEPGANYTYEEQSDGCDSLWFKQAVEIALRVIIGAICLPLGVFLMYRSLPGYFPRRRWLYVVSWFLLIVGCGSFFLPVYWDIRRYGCSENSKQDNMSHGLFVAENDFGALTSEQFPHLPHMICNLRFHRWGHSQSLVNAAEIVPREVKSQHRAELLPLLAESVRQPGESPHLHSHGEVRALDVRGADLGWVWVAIYGYFLAARAFGWRVARFVFGVGRVQLHELGEVNLLDSKAENHSVLVRLETVRSDLKTAGGSSRQLLGESNSIGLCAASEVPRERQFAMSLDCDEGPSVPDGAFLFSLLGLCLLFHPDVAPKLVALNFFYPKTADALRHQLIALFTSPSQQVEDGAGVDSGNSGSAANGATLDQVLQNGDGFFFGQDHVAEQTHVFLSECLFAVQAAVALQAVAVLSELLCGLIARRAVHLVSPHRQRQNITYCKHCQETSFDIDVADYNLYRDRRLGGLPRYFIGRPDDADMFVPRVISECVCFICVKERGRWRPKATAFFVSVPVEPGVIEGGHLYLVTAKHCVEKAKQFGSMSVRINTKSGNVLYEEVKEEWLTLEEEATDVAVLPFAVPEEADIRSIPVWMMATDEEIRLKKIGIGDEIAVTGLFSKIPGTSKNLPILRGGMISAMPGEIMIGDDGGEYEAYLVEMRSIGGLSGSPVFVVKIVVDEENKTSNLGLQLFSRVFLLIGVIRGHWEQNNIEDVDDETLSRREPLNTGIATVTPIQECLRILNGEELTRARRRQELEWRKANSPIED